ncbi:MAG: type II CAAX endopeptidase family protein [Gemmatimonadaceae bacterium]
MMRRVSALSLFFITACLLSWLVWLPKVAGVYGWWAIGAVSPYWHLVGSLGPAIAALIVTYCTGGMSAVKDLWRVVVRWRTGWRWWAVAMGPVFILLFAAAAVRMSAGELVNWQRVLHSEEYPALGSLALLGAQIICYGFGEEIGWRGFALPRLLQRQGALRASILLSVPWAIWHIPLLVTNDTYRSMSPIMLLGWYVSLLTGSVLLTWLFVRGGRNVLLVALFHATLDLVMVNAGVTPSMLPVMGALVTVWGCVAGVLLVRDARVGAVRDEGGRARQG